MIINLVKGTVIAAGAMMLGAETDAIGADTPVRLGAAIVVGASIVSGTWWLSKKLTRQRMEQKQMHDENKRETWELKRLVAQLCQKQGIPVPDSFRARPQDEPDDNL